MTIKWQKERRLQKSIDRWSERERRLASREKIPDLDIAWAAGHFEGEGTVTLTRAGRVMHVRPMVSLTSTDRCCRDFFDDRWPGNCHSRYPKSNREKEAFIWALNSGERIQAFLLDILPHIRTERVRQKITIVLDDIQDRGLYQQQIEVRSRSEQRRLLIRNLNAKGAAGMMVYGDIRVMLPIATQGYGKMVPLLEGPRT